MYSLTNSYLFLNCLTEKLVNKILHRGIYHFNSQATNKLFFSINNECCGQ